MDNKEFDWDDVDQFLKDWENLDKIRDEFIDDIITDAATFFVENNPQYNLVLEDFIEISKKELNLTAMDFFFILGDLLYHYDNNKTDFFSFDLEGYNHYDKEYDDTRSREFAKENPQIPAEHIEDMIRQSREDWNYQRDYNNNFHKLMKKGITDYLYNMEILTPRAFRELDFVCYQKMDDFEFAFEQLLSKRDKEEDENTEEKNNKLE